MTEETHEIKMAMLVNRYATPLAVLLVSMGIMLAAPRSPLREIAVGLLVFSIVFNFATMRLLRSGRIEGLLGTRLTINLTVNIVLVYILGEHWTPIWLLLPLTPMAMALYDSRRATLATSLAVSAALLIIQAARGPSAPVQWGQIIAYSSFIVVVSLLLNDLAQRGFRR